jgi:hypothetical protein
MLEFVPTVLGGAAGYDLKKRGEMFKIIGRLFGNPLETADLAHQTISKPIGGLATSNQYRAGFRSGCGFRPPCRSRRRRAGHGTA